jgi:hypothetical protein
VPAPVAIPSAPTPPSTIDVPVPVPIVSLPPTPGAVVSTRPSVIGAFGVSARAETILPLSPSTMLVPSCVVIWSSPMPPTTIA